MGSRNRKGDFLKFRKKVVIRKGDFLKLRREVARANIPLENIVCIIRLIDDYLYLYNLERICWCREGSVIYKEVNREIINYKKFIEALEIINEVEYSNCSTRKLRSGEETVATFQEYESAK